MGKEIIDKIKEVSATIAGQAVESAKHSMQIKKVGTILIDEQLRQFKVELPSNSSGLAKKTTLAMLTGGLSIAADAATKGIKNFGNKWIPFEDLVDYKYVVDNERVTESARSGVRVVKGVYIGGTKRTSKSVTKSSKFKVTLNNLENPYIEIPIITKPLSGKEFDNAVKLEEETKAALDYILRKQ